MNLLEILTYIFFFLLLKSIIYRTALIEAILVISIIIIATFGEYLNLFVFKATSYTGRVGIPTYIILGGVLIGWPYYKLPLVISKQLKKNNLLAKLCLFFLLSIFFPVIEICGIQLGLWHWLKPYSICNPWWWIGVWKFYMVFLGSVPLIALVMHRAKGMEQRAWSMGN